MEELLASCISLIIYLAIMVYLILLCSGFPALMILICMGEMNSKKESYTFLILILLWPIILPVKFIKNWRNLPKDKMPKTERNEE